MFCKPRKPVKPEANIFNLGKTARKIMEMTRPLTPNTFLNSPLKGKYFRSLGRPDNPYGVRVMQRPGFDSATRPF